MNIGDRLGSDELTPEEFEQFNNAHSETLDELRKLASISDDAKRFLNTPFGLELRKVLVAEKLAAMKSCAQSLSSIAKEKYDIICGVERIFSLIISDGDEALRQLQAYTGDDDE